MPAERRNAGEAYKLGQEGGNAPDWVLNDPSGHFLRQFELGQQTPAAPPTPAGPPSPQGGPAGGGGRRTRPARKGASPTKRAPAAGRGRRAGGGLANSMFRPVRVAPPRVPVPTGDVGGLLLALVLYPIGLSLVRYGAAGPGIWLRAKFLNQTTPEPKPATRSGGGGVQHSTRS